MSDKVKERKEIEEQYKWDLSTLFADDAAWEKEFSAVDEAIAEIPSWQGRLNTAANIRE